MTNNPAHPIDRINNSARFETRPELERALHQTLGLPKAAAKKLVAGGWPALSREQPADHRPQPLRKFLKCLLFKICASTALLKAKK